MKVGLLMPNTEYDEFLSEISGESNNNSIPINLFIILKQK